MKRINDDTLANKFDSIVESLIHYSKIDLTGKEVYSWEFTPEHLNPEKVFLGYRPTLLSASMVVDGVSGKMYRSEHKNAEEVFMIEMKTFPYGKENTALRNFIITNKRPMPTLFKDDEWHCDVGKWYNGLK